MRISSPAFGMNQFIPQQYTCDGKNVNPRLVIESVPREAKSLALIVDDPDAPGKVWVHWTAWNINPKIHEIAENSVPKGIDSSTHATQGKTDFGSSKWGGPCPPSGAHHYRFKLYALNAELDLPAGAKEPELVKAMEGKEIAKSEWVGLYQSGR